MPNRKKTSARAVIAILAAAAFTTAAQAANCGLVGKWHYSNLIAFGSGQAIADCSIVIKPNGAFTGQCDSWTLGQAATSGGITGSIKADRKCDLSGFTHTAGFSDVTIRGGHVRGTVATFIGTRGDTNSPTNVRLVTLVKE
jgi:hypothetical protein